MSNLAIAPLDLASANEFVRRVHRHHPPVVGHKFSLAAVSNGLIVGVVIVGRPVARGRDDGWTMEVTRLATDGTKNACSFLYGAAARAAFALGYRRIGTYILASEPGTSLAAAGWRMIGEVRGRSWDCPTRPRIDLHPTLDKLLFERAVPQSLYLGGRRVMISYDDIKSGRAAMPAEKAPEVRDHDLDLSDIKLDQSAQPREALNNDRIAEYADGMKAGDQFPPLTVFHDGSTYWLADGFHRHYAAQHAGRKHIRCHVRQGGLRDAILWSVGANAKHGLARSDEDKRRAVLRLLADEEWSGWSDREIARRCRVSDKFVAKQRPVASADHPQIERKVQRGGTVYTQKVAKAKSAAAPEPQETKASEPESVNLAAGGAEPKEITPETVVPQGVDGDARTDAERDAYAIQWEFDRASDEGRALFMARNNLRQESNPSTATGGDDVDRSAERASSAVEVGAPVSPERAPRRLDDLGSVQDGLKMSTDGQPKTGLSTDCIERPIEARVTAGETAPNSPSVAPTAEPEAIPSPPPASGTHSNPQPTSSLVSDKAEAAPPPVASATPFAVMSKADQIRLLRPHCRHADDLDKCGGVGAKYCTTCKKAIAEGEVA